MEVNIEPALRLSDRLGGHLVAGHVDGVGTLKEMEAGPEFWVLTIQAPPEIIRYCIEKGSVAVNGVSLTVNKVTGATFQLGIIPHTLQSTTLHKLKPGDKVNLETDMIGKYVEKFVRSMTGQGDPEGQEPGEKIDATILAKHGFLK